MEPRLSFVTIGVADVARARTFYEKLGFRRFGAMSGSPKGASRHFYVKKL